MTAFGGGAKINTGSAPLLQVDGLKKYFPVKSGWLRRTRAYVKAVDGVSFKVERGRTLGLVGESGCGKSTLGRNVIRLQDPTDGKIVFDGVDVTRVDSHTLKSMRQNFQMIFQDPYASLNPRMNIHKILREPLDTHGIGTVDARERKIAQLLDVVGLRKNILGRFPHEFSGGQRQRIGIARALTLDPKMIVADEPVSALDVSVQAQVLNLIKDLQDRLGLAFLFIAHDLAVVQHISHDVGVMYLGKIVELASADDLYRAPKHPYTQALLSAVPVPDPRRKRDQIVLRGEVPSPLNPPTGCRFHTRCPYVMDKCKEKEPTAVNVASGGKPPHLVNCYLYC